VPVLTLMGDSFAGRVGASLLHAIGLDELITQSESAYETLAIALATDLGRLRIVRDKLRANRLTAPLFDTVRFVRHLEAAFEMMHARAQAGLPPDHIQVDGM
jgi:predicted O-linked N-acetylglucosamine transferase (SPINDLY family)